MYQLVFVFESVGVVSWRLCVYTFHPWRASSIDMYSLCVCFLNRTMEDDDTADGRCRESAPYLGVCSMDTFSDSSSVV